MTYPIRSTARALRLAILLAGAGAGALLAAGCVTSDGGSGGTGGAGAPGTGGTAVGAGGSPGSGGSITGSGGSVTGLGGSGVGGAGAGGSGPGGRGTGGGALGGSTGSGGVAGTGGRGTGGGTTVTPILSADFETGTAGQQPAGWDNFLDYQKNIANPSPSGTMAVIDTTHAHGGTKAVKFHGGSNPAMLTRPLAVGTNKLYVRAWFYMTRQLGMNPGANHETLIGIRKATGSANDEVRFGEIKGVIGTNEVPTDNISPKMAQWGLGPVVAANRWACIEVAFLANQPQHTLYAWADGVMVHSITAPDQWQNSTMPANWMNGKFVEVILGWQSFSSNTIDVWMDDLVLASERIGCN